MSSSINLFLWHLLNALWTEYSDRQGLYLDFLLFSFSEEDKWILFLSDSSLVHQRCWYLDQARLQATGGLRPQSRWVFSSHPFKASFSLSLLQAQMLYLWTQSHFDKALYLNHQFDLLWKAHYRKVWHKDRLLQTRCQLGILCSQSLTLSQVLCRLAFHTTRIAALLNWLYDLLRSLQFWCCRDHREGYCLILCLDELYLTGACKLCLTWFVGKCVWRGLLQVYASSWRSWADHLLDIVPLQSSSVCLSRKFRVAGYGLDDGVLVKYQFLAASYVS